MSQMSQMGPDQILAHIESTPRRRNEIDRILAIPTKTDDPVPDLTVNFRKRGGTMTLRPVQSQVLFEAHRARGLLGLIGIGKGKTLASFLLPWVWGAERPLLLIKASLREQCMHDWGEYGAHFLLPPSLYLHSYEELSRQTNLLTRISPDAIICDEVHALRNGDCSRVKRMTRYMRQQEGKVAFAGLSGSITSRSIMDFTHIAAWALGDNSPLPKKRTYIETFCRVLDRGGEPRDGDETAFRPIVEQYGGSPREAFQARLQATPGVIISRDNRPPSLLRIHRHEVDLPEQVSTALKTLQDTWTTPSGEEVYTALEHGSKRSEISCGFEYVWKWPNDTPDEEWLDARKVWGRAIRRMLQKDLGEGMDSPALIEQACVKYCQGESLRLPRFLFEAYQQWLPQKHKDKPPTAIRWISTYLAEEAIAWAKGQAEPPILWYGHSAIAQKLYQLSGWPVFAGGAQASRALLGVKKPVPAIVSIAAHHDGKNLQTWGNSLLLHPETGGARLDQMYGRYHRTGQGRDAVDGTYIGTGVFSDAMDRARMDARYIEELTGVESRLNYAEWTAPRDQDPLVWTEASKAKLSDRYSAQEGT